VDKGTLDHQLNNRASITMYILVHQILN